MTCSTSQGSVAQVWWISMITFVILETSTTVGQGARWRRPWRLNEELIDEDFNDFGSVQSVVNLVTQRLWFSAPSRSTVSLFQLVGLKVTIKDEQSK